MDTRKWNSEMLGVLLWVLTTCITDVSSECSSIKVEGTRYQSTREGTYKATDNYCNGKTIYEDHSGGDSNYIYFIVTNDGWEGWMIGSNSCTNKGGMAVEDDADSPDQVEENWEEVYGGSWWYTSAKVVCADLSIGTIVGIVIGVLIVISLVGLTIYCCCKSSISKNTTRTNRTSSPQRTGARSTTRVAIVSQANPTFNYGQPTHSPGGTGVPPPQMAWTGGPPAEPIAPPPYSTYGPPPMYPPVNDPAYPPGQPPARFSMSPPPAYSEEIPK